METFWRYLRVQAFVFVCGIVGPIFLIVYFATQPDPTIKWMYWAGLFITALDVFIALGLTSAASRGNPKPSRSEPSEQ
ncbi:hypothetical protein [Mycolicibacterium sp. YH-1]|uniref:hypothetical protein n=1 Tax=Mycolicibacterium sp. YH-1 TaxID=2908837 RepID=UPI001F4C1FF0|nr:hypothetical protein [Mycolicibacterium sp. YH-1]UNB55702.1 hypothetical protein L0M16_16130 [Mycolicibacterium sp. YH-1]